MAKITGLPDLGHDWKPVRVDDGPLQYECRCLLRSPVPHRDSFCPDAVLDYANRLVAEERARAVAVLDGLRDCIRSLSRFESDDYTAGWNDAADRALDAVNDTITTLPGSDR